MELVALIMAGGEGKRFWPLSTKSNPKQFLSLAGEKSLLRQTVDRILPLIPIENIYIVTGEVYADQTMEHIPELPGGNLILEPVGKNTAPCIAYGELVIKKNKGDSVTVVLPADHVIGNDREFRDAINFASDMAYNKLDDGDFPLITFGVSPTTAETGYGYIEASDSEIGSSEDFTAYRVEKFTEKPDLDTAKSYVEHGGYYWNSGIFVWKTEAILSAFAEIVPAWHEAFDQVADAIGSSSEKDAVINFYDLVEFGSIDKVILEHSRNTGVIPISFPWSDIGSWCALDQYLRKEGQENLIKGKVISMDSKGCMVLGSEKLLALVGVDDLVVVESGDSILILNKQNSQDVKKVVEEIEKAKK